MDSPESHSPPRRKRLREPSPDLATLFHGLTAVSTATTKGSAKRKGKDRANESPAVDGGGGTGGGGASGGVLDVSREGVQSERANDTAQHQPPKTLPRPPTAPLRPIAPLHRQLVTASTFDPPLLTLATPLSSPLPPLIPGALTQVEPSRRRLYRGRGASTASSHWAARVLSPIVRQEQRERDLLRSRSSAKRGVVESEGEGETVSVDDFLAALPSKPGKKVGRKYGIRTLKERREKAEKKHSARGEEEEPAPKRAKRQALEADDDEGFLYSPRPPKRKRKPRRRVLIDYLSYSNGERPLETDAPPRRRPRPTKQHIRLARQFNVASSPAPLPKIRKQLVFVKESQLEGSQRELYAKKVRGREIKRVDPRKGTPGAFLSSLGDTAFGGMRGSREVREGGKSKTEGQQRVTSRAFPFAEVEELAVRGGTGPAIGVKRRRLSKQTVGSRYRALEMVAEEDSEIGGVGAFEEQHIAQRPVDKRAPVSRPQIPATARKPHVSAPPTPPTASRPRRAQMSSTICSSATTPLEVPSTSKRQSDRWPEKVEKMEHAFRRKLRKPVVDPQRTQVMLAIQDDDDSSSEDEHEGPHEPLDPLTLLPTPAISKFRFITGIKAKIRPQIDLVPADEVSSCELSPPQSILDEVPARLQLVSEAEFDAAREKDVEEEFDREELAILASEWDAHERAGTDSSLECGGIDFSESQLRQLDAPSPLLPSGQQQPSLPPEKRLQRHVTFSSPVPSPRRLPPSTPHLVKPRRTPAKRRNSTASAVKALCKTPVCRSKTILATSVTRPLPPSSGMSRTTSSGARPKILRRLSLRPDFRLPSTPSIDIDDDHATHASSHSFTQRSSLSPSPLPLPPPAQQNRAPAPSVSQDYIQNDGTSFEERLVEAAERAKAQEVDIARKENAPSLPQLSPVATRVPSNPNAILSRASSDSNARTVARRRSTTVWRGQRLDQLGVMPLPETR